MGILKEGIVCYQVNVFFPILNHARKLSGAYWNFIANANVSNFDDLEHTSSLLYACIYCNISVNIVKIV